MPISGRKGWAFREKWRKILKKINAFHKIILERHLILYVTLVNFQILFN